MQELLHDIVEVLELCKNFYYGMEIAERPSDPDT